MKGAITMSEQAVGVRRGSTKLSTKELTTTGMMIGIILLMAMTPLGYIRTAGLSISLIPIPVAIGAMIIGPKAGLLLGAIFGCTSFYMAFGMSPFTSTLMGINPLLTFILCVPTRALMGWLTGVLFQVYEKMDRSKTLCFFLGGFTAAFLNTLLFMSTLVLCFWNTDFIQGLNAGFGDINPIAFVIAFVGINGACEMPASCIIGGGVAKTLRKVIHKKVRSN